MKRECGCEENARRFGQVDGLNTGVGVVIVAAGKGTRMGTRESKQYLQLDDKPILVHTLSAFDRMRSWTKSCW